MVKAKHVSKDTPVVVDIEDTGKTRVTIDPDDDPVVLVADDPVTMETVIVEADLELKREEQQP